MSNPNCFDTRNGGQDITWCGNVPSDNCVPAGSTVTLKAGDVSVCCTIQNVNGETYTGTITSFENWNEPEWNGWSIGSQITFEWDCIYSCDCSSVAA